MWTPNLDDVMNAPTDPDALRKHLEDVGALAPPPAQPAAPLIPELTRPAIGTPPTATVPFRPPTRLGDEHLPAMKSAELPEPESMVRPVGTPELPAGGGVAGPSAVMPTLSEVQKRELPLTSPGMEGGSVPYYQSQLDQALEAERGHPMSQHPGFWGKVGHVLGNIGNVALNAAVPGLAETIPGTQAYKTASVERAKGELAGEQERESKEKLQAAETEKAQAETRKMGAAGAPQFITDGAGNVVGWTDEKGQPHSKSSMPPDLAEIAKDWKTKDTGKEEEWTELKDYSGPNGEPMEIERHSGNVRVAGGDTGAKKTTKAEKLNEFEQFYQDYIKDNNLPDSAHNRLIARREWMKSGREEPSQAGTWAIAEDAASGKPILYNSKTGTVREAPEGLQKSGTKAKADAALEKEIGPARDAMQFANDYLSNGVFTGPSDEALQEKFFELAKPTTGFRMTQPQIDMLQHSREWRGSAEAYLRHATKGTWFSDKQRKEIVDTMNTLGNAKMKHLAGAGAGGGGGGEGGGTGAPKKGDVVKGYEFLGGDPNDKNNWKKQKKP